MAIVGSSRSEGGTPPHPKEQLTLALHPGKGDRHPDLAATVALLNRTYPVFRGWEYRDVHRLTRFELLTLQGHISNVTSASYSADGSRIVTSCYDQMAKVWNASPINRNAPATKTALVK